MLSLKSLDNESISKFVKNLLELRIKEIEDFKNFHQLMRKFLKFLQSNNQIANKGKYILILKIKNILCYIYIKIFIS